MVGPGWYAIVGGAAVLVACGGTAVIDGSDETGAGGAPTTATSTTTTVTTTTSSTATNTATNVCDGLELGLVYRIDAAQSCNPYINTIQCSGAIVIYDRCGCEAVANDGLVDEAELAIDAYDDWVNAGCGPLDCDSCPPPASSPWYCDPFEERCLPAYE